MHTLESVQEKVRSRFAKSSTPRRLEWQRINQQVIRADDYEIHRSGPLGHFTYELHKTPFHQVLWGPCETAKECQEMAALHQVLK